MKKVFENPNIAISLFCTENIITTSGIGSYETKVRNELSALNVINTNLTERKYENLLEFIN